MDRNAQGSLINPLDEGIGVVPEAALESIGQQVEQAGGEWREPPEYEGSVGRTMFDTPASADGTVTVLLAKENIGALPSQSLVRIKSVADGRSYLGAVVKGPFAEPDGLRADAPIVVTATVRGGIFMPKYHGRVQVELIGEELGDGGVVPPRRRPLPNSPVFALTPDETAGVLKTGGDIRLGVADGQEDIEVRVPSAIKSVLPRHTGILGTTGGGKSTTVSGLVTQLQKADVACIILDTEGEYTTIHEPSDDQKMQSALNRREMTPMGVDNTHVYHLVGRETANPQHPSLTEFKLDFSDLSPHAVKEILDFTPAQELRFFQAFDVCKQLLRDLGVYPARGNRTEEQQALEIDELETGYPGMTLSQLIDVAGIFQHNLQEPRRSRTLQSDFPQQSAPGHAARPSGEVRQRGKLAGLAGQALATAQAPDSR